MTKPFTLPLIWLLNSARFSQKTHQVDFLNPLSANPTKWSNTLKQSVGKLPTNCLSVFDNFVGLALKGLIALEFEEPVEKLFSLNKNKVYLFSI